MSRIVLLLTCLLFAHPAEAIDWGAADQDGDGYSIDDGDCNDDDPEIHPGATEDCGDELDNDCDLSVDYDDPQCTPCGACHTSPGRASSGALLVMLVVFGLRRLS